MKKLTKKGKRILSIFISICLVIPIVIVIAKAARLPDAFFDDGGWTDANRQLAWFAYNHSDYAVLGSYLADESYSGTNYDNWYGDDAEILADMIASALDSLPTPSSGSQAKSYFYNGYSPKAFIPMMMAVINYADSDKCEVGFIGEPGCRVINFSSMGYSISIENPDWTDDEINAARIRVLYQIIISKCHKYTEKCGCTLNLNYCSLPMMRVIEAVWNEESFDAVMWKEGKAYSDDALGIHRNLSVSEFEYISSKKDINDLIALGCLSDHDLKNYFPHGYYAMSIGTGSPASYAMCPAKTGAATHTIIDTGSLYYFSDEDDIEDNSSLEQ